MRRKRMRRRHLVPCVCICAALLAPGARADVEVADLPKALDSFKVGVELNAFYRADSKPFFGGERKTAAGKEIDDDHWGEVFSKMRFTAGKKFGWSEGSAQFGLFYAQTVDQDGYGLAKDTNQLGVDQAWISLAKLFGSPIEVKIGRQDIQIEKWFLIAQGDTQDAANWLFYHYSFPMAAVVNADLSPVKATAFWARPGIAPDGTLAKLDGTGDVDLLGVNLHYDIVKDTYVYAGVYHTIDNSLDLPNNLTTWDVGGQVKPFEAITLEGEVAAERGDKDGADRKGLAWWASGTYTLPVVYTPYVRGTYVFYSGDKDPNDDTFDAFEPMYSSFIGWNRWVQGEQTGELWLGRTNKKVAIAEVGFNPLPPMIVSLHYLNHRIDQTASFGTHSDKWGDELNLFMDYQMNDQLFLHLGTGMVKPGEAAKEVTGNDKNAYFGQMWLKFAI
jgi:hypothetical protein